MSRFSPTTAPEYGPSGWDQAAGVVSSVAQGLEARRQRHRQQQADQEATVDRTRRMAREDWQDAATREQQGRQRTQDAISLYNSGYREGEPPPAGAPGPGSGVAGALEQQRGNSLQGQPAYQAPPQASAPNARGNFTQAEQSGTGGVADLLQRRRAAPDYGNQLQAGQGYPGQAAPPPQANPVTALGQKYYRIGTGYVDPSQTPEGRKAATAEWQPHTMQEGIDYERQIHPERLAKPEGTPVSWTTETLPDGRVIQVNPQTGQSRPIARSGARLASPEEGAAGRRTLEDQDAEGNAVLGLMSKGGTQDPHTAAFWKSYQQIIAANPKWHPGRVAFQANKVLKENRPDLFPVAPAKEKPSANDDPLAYLKSVKEKRAGGAVAKPAADAKANPAPAKNRADRWEELVSGGMSAEEATAKVQQELP